MNHLQRTESFSWTPPDLYKRLFLDQGFFPLRTIRCLWPHLRFEKYAVLKSANSLKAINSCSLYC